MSAFRRLTEGELLHLMAAGEGLSIDEIRPVRKGEIVVLHEGVVLVFTEDA